MMKNRFLIGIYIAFIVSIVTGFNVFAQNVNETKISAPFGSLGLTDVKALGNPKTGIVELTMNFKNDYTKSAGVSLAIGGFEDMGITDAQGHKYKLYTTNNAVNTNKGFQNIPFVQFGDKKFTWVATVKQEMAQGETRKLTIRIKALDKDIKTITDFHIRCILSLDYEHIGDQLYRVENIPIEWK